MLHTETILTLSEAARKLPKLDGKRPHTSTIWRWARRGIQGVHLETRRIGGRLVTSLEALDRFTKALSEIELPERGLSTPQPRKRTDRQRQRSMATAESVLRRAKILP